MSNSDSFAEKASEVNFSAGHNGKVYTDCQLTEQVIENKGIFSGRVFSVEVSEVLLQNGNTAFREIVRHNGGAAVVALDDDRNVYMVRQFRCPFFEIMLEIPAGKLEMGEDPKECAFRELTEETGLIAQNIDDLGVFYPSPGYCSEKLFLFLATGLTLKESNPDEGEYLNVHRIPLDTLLQKIDLGEIKDGKTIAALLKTARRLELELG